MHMWGFFFFFTPSHSRMAAVAVGWVVWSCEPPEDGKKKKDFVLVLGKTSH